MTKLVRDDSLAVPPTNFEDLAPGDWFVLNYSEMGKIKYPYIKTGPLVKAGQHVNAVSTNGGEATVISATMEVVVLSVVKWSVGDLKV